MAEFGWFYNYGTETVHIFQNGILTAYPINNIPYNLWIQFPEIIKNDLLTVQRDLHLRYLRQQERIIRLAVLFVNSRKSWSLGFLA